MALKSDQGPSGLKVWAPGDPPVSAVAVIEFVCIVFTWRHVAGHT